MRDLGLGLVDAVEDRNGALFGALFPIRHFASLTLLETKPSYPTYVRTATVSGAYSVI